jgi:hypothetical protein
MPYKDKEARAEYLRAYYKANREKLLLASAENYKANKDKRRAYQQAYYDANKEKIKEYQKAHVAAKREQVLARHKDYALRNSEKRKLYREANKQAALAYGKKYREARREDIRAKEKAACSSCSPSYVRRRLTRRGFPKQYITRELVEVSAYNIQIRRHIKEMTA